jgi:hypothetical protein
MEKTLFDQKGEAIAYITSDYRETIYLWEGWPLAYLYGEEHVYGINGRHLGWFITEILYNNHGDRIGFTSSTCPVAIAKEPTKDKKHPKSEIRSKWKAPPLPKLSFRFASQNLADFLREGQVVWFHEESSSEKSPE